MIRRRLTRAESQAQTRADLLAAAGRVFARRGYEGASIAEVADEAGYSHGAVYSNFEGKQDLFLALYETWVARRVDEIGAAWDGGDGLADRARASGDEWMQWFETNPEAFLLRLEFTVRAAHDPDLRRELATRVGAVPLAISRMVERAAQDEGLDLPLPADEIALGLQALSLGLALESLTTRVRPGLNGDLAAFLIELLGARSDA
jgi:AcrR family transcriptional regulator